MPYNNLESSSYLGRPSLLYQISIDSKIWYLTGADSDISAGGNLYKAIGIEDDGVKQTGEVQTDGMSIRLPITHDLISLFVSTPPINDVLIRRFRKHENDAEVICNYVGFINNVNFTNPGVAEITCQTLSPTMKRNGLRLTYQRGCPYALYDSATCKVNKNSHRLTTKVSSADGGLITVLANLEAYGDNYFTGGFIEWIDRRTGGPNRRAIKLHIGNTITLLGRSDGVALGDDVNLFPGCNRVADTCNSKFNNMPNYGGIIHMPGKSPFGGDPIF